LELQGEDEGGRIESLKQLVGVPGMGVKTVERMLEGVPAGI
jgi:DNA uptake protein ComE-like DNA-binding protein